MKVVIADDENRICRLIQALIDWDEIGLELAGFASNGIEALALLKREHPDILITDIRMPGCDGLDLIRRAHEICPDLQIVIISGYANFSYAQTALKYGVYDYLLKPINKEELCETLQKIKVKIEEMRQEEAAHEDTKRHQKEDARKLRQLMIERLLDIQAPAITEEMFEEQYHFPVREGLFLGFCLRVDDTDHEKTHNMMSTYQERMEKVFECGLRKNCYEWSFYQHHFNIYGVLNCAHDRQQDVEKSLQDALNQMWRNGCINDTYEPGSTFKIITASAGLEEGAVHLTDQFSCPGYKVVEDRRIRCHKVGGHGAENFVQGIQNSCNPVFIEVGLRIGVDRFFDYFRQFGLMDLTGVDIPGEAGTIMHKKENVGQVELATISFGQSFQITPIQLATTVSALVNGGRRVTPHFGMEVLSAEGKKVKTFRYNAKKHIVSEKTSQTMRELLESVVAEGSGKNAYVEGYRIGGKTATSQTLPRSANKYISSFVGFAPADDPQILGMCVIYNPQGVYYGGTIAAPVIGKIFENILPYLGIEKQ